MHRDFQSSLWRRLYKSQVCPALLICLYSAASAQAQVVLDAKVASQDVLLGDIEPVSVTLTIRRADSSEATDAEVTALGAAVSLPEGWVLVRDPDDNCAFDIKETQAGSTANPAVNATVNLRGAGTGYSDPPDNTTCVALPTPGRALEFFWAPQSPNALPIDFPVELTFSVLPTDACTPEELHATIWYRVLGGGQQTASDAGFVNAFCDPCLEAGDANVDGNVDPNDAQLVFQYYLGLPEGTGAVNPACADFCGGGGIDPADAQGIFGQFLQLPNPCQ